MDHLNKRRLCTFNGRVLSIAALNSDPDMIDLFRSYAGAIPRDTQFDWKYEKQRGESNNMEDKNF